MAAESYILNSDATVIGMGGFSGGDPAPTADQLAQWVNQGQLRFVLFSQRDDHQRGGQRNGGGMAGFGRSAAGEQRTQWLQQHCTAVNPTTYGGSTQPQQNALPFGPFGGAQTLYDCRAH